MARDAWTWRRSASNDEVVVRESDSPGASDGSDSPTRFRKAAERRSIAWRRPPESGAVSRQPSTTSPVAASTSAADTT